MKKVLLINGPPHSGKDYTGEIIGEQLDEQGVWSEKYKMTSPMDLALMAFFSLTEEEYMSVREGQAKEEPSDFFFGATCRRLLQTFSEWWVKKLCGDDVFGKIAARNIRQSHGIIVTRITDSGFNCEIGPLVEEFGVENIFGIRMHRDGCSFEGDTREWLGDDHGFSVVDINNTGVDFELVEALAECNPLQEWLRNAVSVS